MCNPIPKEIPWRSREYREWIKSLPCVASGMPADDCHHITGTKKGGMGTKIGDESCIPMTRFHHNLLHQDPEKWEEVYGKQSNHLIRIVEQARKEGMLPAFEAWTAGL